ncbi:hypothetical protein NMG60_11034921 [Bertholletia excelsa]
MVSKTTRTEEEMSPWSDLPPELLSPIAEKLGLIDLLGFRGTCKDWLSASSTATAQTGCSPCHYPWFLLYGDEGSKCILYDLTEKKKYTVDVPELEGSTCLASALGWLLLFREGSIFFFCPFSRARIELPPFPYPTISDHVAAVSAPPSSKDSTVCVISRQGEFQLELNILRRGDKAWTTIDYDCPIQSLGVVTGATFQAGCFYFLDAKNKALTYSVNNKKWKRYRIVDPNEERASNTDCLPFEFRRSYFKSHNMKIFTCGTCLPGEKYDLVINNEVVQADTDDDDDDDSDNDDDDDDDEDDEEEEEEEEEEEYGEEDEEEEDEQEEQEEELERRLLKGIWIQPRFLQVPQIRAGLFEDLHLPWNIWIYT